MPKATFAAKGRISLTASFKRVTFGMKGRLFPDQTLLGNSFLISDKKHSTLLLRKGETTEDSE